MPKKHLPEEESEEVEVEGLSDIGDFIAEEEMDEEDLSQDDFTGSKKPSSGSKTKRNPRLAIKESYKDMVEEQNDSLLNGDYKTFYTQFKGLSSSSAAPLPKMQFLKKDGEVSTPKPDAELASIIKMDLPELEKLIESMKNAVMVMRLKIGEIIDKVRQHEVAPDKSISLLNLKVEVLTEYISYLCLFALTKVRFYYFS